MKSWPDKQLGSVADAYERSVPHLAKLPINDAYYNLKFIKYCHCNIWEFGNEEYLHFDSSQEDIKTVRLTKKFKTAVI